MPATKRNIGSGGVGAVAASLVGLVVLSVAARSQAQQRGDSGSIVGYVFDQTGSPLAGVKVTIASDTQIGGRKVAYTNARGRLPLPGAGPGRVPGAGRGAQAADRRPEQRQGRHQRARPRSTSSWRWPPTKVEEVKVVEKPPLVSTTTANVKEVYDVDFVDSMPHDNRDVIFQQITNYTAGSHPRRPHPRRRRAPRPSTRWTGSTCSGSSRP